MGQVSSQFSPGEISSVIIAWLVLSIAITYQNFLGLFTGMGSFEIVIAGFVATATGFIIHEMGHKFVAIRRGYVAHFRLWMWGLLLTLFIVVFSGGGIVFGAPGAVYIAPAATAYYGYDSTIGPRDSEQENMVISAAGPGINLAFAVTFLSLFFVAPLGSFLSTIAQFGFLLNAGLGSFNMIPIPPLDGSKIFRKNISVALAIALPLWAMLFLGPYYLRI
ncbi:MAG TPA: site-2 protease family protein [Candidatus Angelobacter sp.]|nr:site-2 protease family protein [Candidatus Angelobacter sp.]